MGLKVMGTNLVADQMALICHQTKFDMMPITPSLIFFFFKELTPASPEQLPRSRWLFIILFVFFALKYGIKQNYFCMDTFRPI